MGVYLNEKLKEQLLEIADNPETRVEELKLLESIDDFDIMEAVQSNPNYEE